LAEVVYNTIFKFKRGSAETWTRLNPVLESGEPGYEKDTGKLKIGDGTTAWNDLKYFEGEGTLSPDEKTLTISGDAISLMGFETASAGQSIRKTESGEIEWFRPLSADDTLVLYGGSATDNI
jgi:hypothetical protein